MLPVLFAHAALRAPLRPARAARRPCLGPSAHRAHAAAASKLTWPFPHSWPAENRAHPQAYHQEGFDNLQAAVKRTGRLCASVMDTRGPEMVVLNWWGQAEGGGAVSGCTWVVQRRQRVGVGGWPWGATVVPKR